jgi:phosphopantetheinyl transferase
VPVFFQQQINDSTRLGVWKIEETEEFFKGNVPQHRDVTHPHKRLQHLAGRFLLQYLKPDFPYEQIQLADTRKPYLANEKYHFSISHCGDYAAAIVSSHYRVGIDVEIPAEKVLAIREKFLSLPEQNLLLSHEGTALIQHATLLWSCKEAVFKWFGDIRLSSPDEAEKTLVCDFGKTNSTLTLHYQLFEKLVLAWTVS